VRTLTYCAQISFSVSEQDEWEIEAALPGGQSPEKSQPNRPLFQINETEILKRVGRLVLEFQLLQRCRRYGWIGLWLLSVCEV